MADRGQAGPAQTGSALKPSRKGGGATRAAGAPGQGKRQRDAKKSVGFSNKQDVFEIPARQAKRAKQPAQRKAGTTTRGNDAQLPTSRCVAWKRARCCACASMEALLAWCAGGPRAGDEEKAVVDAVCACVHM